MTAMPATAGLHHVTALASDPSANVRFYTRVLAQRLVKRTVNFDDPETYHLYYGDEVGAPGTVMTFFPWPRAKRGTVGAGETGAVAYAVPESALDAWHERLTGHEVPAERSERWGRGHVRFTDPDGLTLELVGVPFPAEVRPWPGATVPTTLQLHGFEHVTLDVAEVDPTAELLREMGFEVVDERPEGDGVRLRLETGHPGPGAAVEVRSGGAEGPSKLGPGSVHHVAFRVPDDDAQAAAREALLERGFEVTEVKDRQYFRSIYAREPGGVLFEFATDGPGFTADEPVDALGAELRLPPWLEAERERLEGALPKLPKDAAGPKPDTVPASTSSS